MMRFTCMALGLSAVALLGGCMTAEPIPQRTSDARVALIGNRDFDLGLLQSKSLVDDHGLLTVDVSVLLSRTRPFNWIFLGDPRVSVWYRFDWLDAEGKIHLPVLHKIIALPGNIVDIHDVAPSEKYVSFRLTVSLAKPEASPTGVQTVPEESGPAPATEVKTGPMSPAVPAAPENGAVHLRGNPGPMSPAVPAAPEETGPPPAAKVKMGSMPPAVSPAVDAKPAEKTSEARTVPEAKVANEVKKSEKPKAPEASGVQPQKLTEPFD